MWMLVHRRVDRVAELDCVFDAAPVGERQRQDARVLVPFGAHPHHWPVPLVVEEPAALVDEPEAPVSAHASTLEDDLLRMLEAERLDGGDGDADDLRLHEADRSYAAGPSTCASLRPRAPSRSKIQKSRPVTCTATL